MGHLARKRLARRRPRPIASSAGNSPNLRRRSLPMFSEAYKNLCIENAEKLRELWEKRGPCFGDFVLTPHDGAGTLMTHIEGWTGVYVSLEHFGEAYVGATANPEWYEWDELVWLPTPRQLMRMLEERGRFLMFNGPYAMKERRYQITAMAEDLDRLDARIDAFGPDRETALLRCLMEVMKDDIQGNMPTSP